MVAYGSQPDRLNRAKKSHLYQSGNSKLVVWTIANQKGGVGKTTTTVTLGALLAQRGHRVLLIDTDPHGSLTYYFGIDAEELEVGEGTTLRSEEFKQLLAYRQALRDWPNDPDFPNLLSRPVEPDWLEGLLRTDS